MPQVVPQLPHPDQHFDSRSTLRATPPGIMPFPLDAHVLTVDTNILHKVDTSNPQNLYSMWTVFARCAESVEQGRRLENISWRLWNRETFCVAAEDKTSAAATSLPRQIPQPAHDNTNDMPQLSGSVDSVVDDEAVDLTSEESALDIIRPRIQRQDSCASSRSRGRERHITADDFEKIVVSIVKEKQPLSAPLPQIASPYMPPQKESPSSLPSFERSGSTTTESPYKSSEEEHDEVFQQPSSSPESNSRTTVVRGFSPSSASIPRTIIEPPRSVPAAVPEPTSEPSAKLVTSKKPAVFVMGGSYSSSEQDQSPDNARAVPAPMIKRNKMFKLGGSSEEDSSVKSALASPKPTNGLLSAQKKQASFSNHVMTRTIDNDAAVADDSETDYVDESAIDDDDDSSDWEDSIEDSGKSSIDDKTYFKRVDSKANLTSRPSLITLMLAQNERAAKLGNAASQSTSAIPRAARIAQGPSLGASPNDSDEAPLMMKRGVRSSPLKPINEIPRSAAQPILATVSHTHLQAALSPRTTRRNMLSTELTESLRRNILNERKQKSSTANAVLRRRHTSHDVANLKQYPEKVYMNKTEEVHPENQYFQRDSFGGYHSKGW